MLFAAEEDKTEAARVVGRNVGKNGQFSYWCPWPAEEEQTKALTSLCAPVGVGE